MARLAGWLASQSPLDVEGGHISSEQCQKGFSLRSPQTEEKNSSLKGRTGTTLVDSTLPPRPLAFSQLPSENVHTRLKGQNEGMDGGRCLGASSSPPKILSPAPNFPALREERAKKKRHPAKTSLEKFARARRRFSIVDGGEKGANE